MTKALGEKTWIQEPGREMLWRQGRLAPLREFCPLIVTKYSVLYPGIGSRVLVCGGLRSLSGG